MLSLGDRALSLVRKCSGLERRPKVDEREVSAAILRSATLGCCSRGGGLAQGFGISLLKLGSTAGCFLKFTYLTGVTKR